MIKIATRASKLALWQANFVAQLLQKEGLACVIVPFETKGDKILNVSIAKIGSKGVFTEELEASLLSGENTIAVHSAKDLQSTMPDGLSIIAFSEREDANDVVISLNPKFKLGAEKQLVGSSSTRRVAMLHRYFPNVEAVAVRGNLQTRFSVLASGKVEALILAYAGVRRMALDQYIVDRLPLDSFTPAVGQGCVAIQVANNCNPALQQAIRNACNHPQTELQLVAERAMLSVLDGGCSVPIFGLTNTANGSISLNAGIVSLDGSQLLQTTESIELGNDTHDQDLTAAYSVGVKAGQKLIEMGAIDMLAAIRAQQAL